MVDGLGAPSVEATKQKADAVLRNFPTHCFVFVGSASDVEALHGGVGHFRRREPSRLALPSYAPAEIASMAAVQLLEAGYSLAPNVGRRSLEAALLSTWPRECPVKTSGGDLAASDARAALVTPHRCPRGADIQGR